MSALNYSKWDKLELSDDEDFECHPNVDKSSMIRWKQAEIYRIRRERLDKKEILQIETENFEKALHLVSATIKKSIDTQPIETTIKILETLLIQFKSIDEKLNQDSFNIRSREWDTRWGPIIPIEFCEKQLRLEKILSNILNPLNEKINENVKDNEILKDSIKNSLLEIETFWKNRKLDIEKELEKDNEEANKKLTSENMYKEGFNSSRMAKEEKVTAGVAPAATKEKVIETIHTPKLASVETKNHKEVNQSPTSSEEDESEEYITNEYAKEYSTMTDMDKSCKFLIQHPEICNQKFSDEILAEAFRLQMDGNFKSAKIAVQQSLSIQYSSLLGKDGVPMFFTRMKNPTHNARQMFLKDVNDTYNRIHQRVIVIKEKENEDEKKEKEMALERLRICEQLDGSLKLPLPTDREPNQHELRKCEIFDGFPYNFQKALILQDVDLINEYLETLSKKEAEETLALCSESGLVSLQEEEEDV